MGNYIIHSAKGTTWGKHKYIAIKNGRYIYPDDSNTSTWDNEKNVSSWDNEKNVSTWDNRGSKPKVHKETGGNLFLPSQSSNRGTTIKEKDASRILADREAAMRYYTARQRGRAKTRRDIGKYKEQDLDSHVKQNRQDARLRAYYTNDADYFKNEGRKKTAEYKKTNIQYKKEKARTALSSVKKSVSDRVSNTVNNAKASIKKSAADRVSRAVRSAKTSAKSSVNKGRAVLSSILSKFKRR